MSNRAIRRLRQDETDLLLGGIGANEEEEESSEDDDDEPSKRSGFAFVLNDSDDDSSSSSSEEENDGENANEESIRRPDSTVKVPSQPISDDNVEEEKDLDALLEEFKIHDDDVEYGPDGNDEKNSIYYDIITAEMETRGLDIDFVQRTSLLGSSEDSGQPRAKRGRQPVFGPPRDNWPRPPHFVGGGIGMLTYDTMENPPAIPWPYCEMKTGDERCPEAQRWFKFNPSDSYLRDCQDLEHVKMSGDPNALALFIAHHPFIVEALFQLSSVLYQTNHSQEGLSLLKRALYVYECASLNSFLQIDSRLGFMDHQEQENELFFSTLFRLIRVSHIAGLPRTSLATSRFLLSLDPLRDPMNVLLAVDHFALATNSTVNDQWLIDFVNSDVVKIHYKDDTSDSGYVCSLLDLPNWSYSYALALFRKSRETKEVQTKADEAIQQALAKFPHVLEQLLVQNEINIASRSFQVDWPSVLGFARTRADLIQNKLTKAAESNPVVRACTSQAHDLIARIFIQQNFKLWSVEGVWKWAFENLKRLQEQPSEILPLQPAAMRYARCDPAEFTDKNQTMPADANPLDPGLVAHAMTIDSNRPRFMQRMNRGGAAPDEFEMAMAGLNQNGTVIAGPPTEMIDPDWPVLEVFWRSFMPWAHVEGVPPPRR